MQNGSVLVFLNGPNLEFSLNGVFGRTESKFEGIYSVPLGIHFMSYRIAKDGTCEGAFVTLIYEATEMSRVILFEWCNNEEIFKIKNVSNFDCNFDKLLEYPGLISYERFMFQQEGSIPIWNIFTRFIDNDKTIKRIFKDLNLSNNQIGIYEITPMIESHHSLLHGFEENDFGFLRFIKIPSLKDFSKSCDSKNLNRCALDRTLIFKSLNYDFSEMLAELQISFLLLTFAQNFEGFQQWIDIITLLLQSFDLSLQLPDDYYNLLKVIQEHLEMCPDDFFTGLMNENKLYKLLNGFFSNTSGFEKEVQFYENKFGWTFCGDEDPEDAPVVIYE